MFYKNSAAFGRAVFGHSSSPDLFQRLRGAGSDFDREIKKVIKESRSLYPDTFVGRSLYLLARKEIGKTGINTEGFCLLSTINTKLDFHHFTDGFFYLPSLPQTPVMVDLFNVDSVFVGLMKNYWLDCCDGDYTEEQHQTDLFLQKSGMMKVGREFLTSGIALKTIFDFRSAATNGRPENHFILTPYYVESSQRRRAFAKMVARYLVQKHKKIVRRKP